MKCGHWPSVHLVLLSVLLIVTTGMAGVWGGVLQDCWQLLDWAVEQSPGWLW